MTIEQFYDKGLAHSSYAIISNGEVILVDPARDPGQYFDFAQKNNAKIIGVIETHPHADFVSSHLEVHKKTGAAIYVSKLVMADYPHVAFDEGDEIKLGTYTLKAINTPGHSPDSICIILIDKEGKKLALFTGDTLFVGDVGRPDLRENVGNLTAKKAELAKAMYQTTREKLMKLPEDVVVYPSHGPGSLCGKNISPELNSTIGKEIRQNYALQPMSERKFVSLLTNEQPFVPHYFGYNVDLNKTGALNFDESIKAVPILSATEIPNESFIIVDTRAAEKYKLGHFRHSINIVNGGKFETWLGSIFSADERFYLLAETKEEMEDIIKKAAKIGYESHIEAGIIKSSRFPKASPLFDTAFFDKHPDKFTIVDVRNTNEVNTAKTFEDAIAIPLPELRDRFKEIPKNKPIVVHCAGGTRSAAGSSILELVLPNATILDMSSNVVKYKDIKNN